MQHDTINSPARKPERTADQPITVTWDDLTSRKVETRLKEQNALARNRQYSQMNEASLPAAAPTRTPLLVGLWRNSVFALALFGLLGGIAAWACGASLRFRTEARADAEQRWSDIHRISEAADKGLLAPGEAAEAIRQAKDIGARENPYFAVMADPKYNAELRTPGPWYSVTALAEATAHNLRATDPAVQAALQAERDQVLAEIVAQDQLKRLIRNILAYGAMGVMIALFLAIALPVTENNLPAVVINGSVGAALGLVGGVLVSLVVDRVYQKVATAPLGHTDAATRQLLARLAVWGVMGLFLTVAPGIVMRNWKKFLIGLLGGLIGGLIGGVLYDPVVALVQSTDLTRFRIPELAAMAAIGLFAGLSTGVIENVAKTGWLRVATGLIAGKQFILYRNPTFVGSGPDCQIYLFRDPKVGRRHAAIHIVPGGFELEDLPLGEATYVNGRPVTRTRLRSGDRVQIGATCLVFQEKAPAA